MTPEQESIVELAEVSKELIRIMQLRINNKISKDAALCRLEDAYKKCVAAKDRVTYE